MRVSVRGATGAKISLKVRRISLYGSPSFAIFLRLFPMVHPSVFSFYLLGYMIGGQV